MIFYFSCDGANTNPTLTRSSTPDFGLLIYDRQTMLVRSLNKSEGLARLSRVLTYQ